MLKEMSLQHAVTHISTSAYKLPSRMSQYQKFHTNFH
jgi:hypothetical protein